MRRRSQRIAARIAVVAMAGGLLTATQAAPAHAANVDQTVATVRQLVCTASSLTCPNLPDLDPVVELLVAVAAEAIDSVAVMSGECLDDPNSTCQQVKTTTLTYVDSAVDLTLACATRNYPLCDTALTLAEGAVATAVALVLACANGQDATCNQVKAAAQELAATVVAFVQTCLAGTNGTCATANETAQRLVTDLQAQAAALAAQVKNIADGLVADAPGTIAGAVQTITDTAGALIGLVVGVVDTTDPSLKFQYSAPVNTGPEADTWLDVWDVVPDTGMELTPEQTTVNVSDGAQQSAQDAAGGTLQPVGPECDPAWHYEIDRSKGIHPIFKPGGTTYSLNNDDDEVGEIALEKAEEVHVGITVSAGIEADAGVILAKVKTTFGVSVDAGKKWTTKVGVSHVVGAHRRGYLAGGANGWETMGHYWHTNAFCRTDIDRPLVTIFTPEVGGTQYGYWSYPAATTRP